MDNFQKVFYSKLVKLVFFLTTFFFIDTIKNFANVFQDL